MFENGGSRKIFVIRRSSPEALTASTGAKDVSACPCIAGAGSTASERELPLQAVELALQVRELALQAPGLAHAERELAASERELAVFFLEQQCFRGTNSRCAARMELPTSTFSG
jgi:hypothetical protein